MHSKTDVKYLIETHLSFSDLENIIYQDRVQQIYTKQSTITVTYQDKLLNAHVLSNIESKNIVYKFEIETFVNMKECRRYH